MVTTLDIKIGHLYTLPDPESGVPVFAEFAKEMRDGRLMFRREGTDREIYVGNDDLERMISDGRAKRIWLDGKGRPLEEIEIDPLSLLDPDESGISYEEQQKRLEKQEQLKKMQMLRFYALRYDAEPRPTRGRLGISKIIKRHMPDAIAAGHLEVPNPTTLLRAVDRCGLPHERPLIAFMKPPSTERRERRWPKPIVEAAARAIEAYWDDGSFSIGDAIYQFRTEATAFAREHDLPLAEISQDKIEESDDTDLFTLRRLDQEGPRDRKAKRTGSPVPCEETVRLWIHKNANWWNWAKRYGEHNANRRFKGRGRAVEATRPLEYVMFDHTKIDVWAVVQDDDGQPLFVARAWLTFAIDVYSRMILGAVLGYEPPSIHSVIACLKQVVTRKDFLLDHYGEWKGACDGWGRPFTIIVDNGKEFVSPSFQASCEAVGIDVEWAPVKSPTYKPYVERIFGTINSILWHKLPGGLPLTPQERTQLGLEPQAEAAFTRTQLEKALWNAIVTLYHVEEHSTLGMAPALKWARGIQLHKRATVHDRDLLDKVVGRGKTGQLSATGVTVDGHRFHDPAKTTMLMNRLGGSAKLSQQRKGVSSSRTVKVRVTWDPGDVSKVHVWDPTTRTSVTLPNWDRQFSQGLSWYAAKKIKEWADERQIKFHSDDAKAAARVAHRQFLLDLLPGIKSVERHRRARVIEPLTELVDGDRVELKYRTQTTLYDQPHDIAAMRAEHDLEIKKGRPFGGKSGAAKGAKTRAKNREAAEAQSANKVPDRESTAAVPTTSVAPDLAAQIKARVAARAAVKADDEGEAA